MSRPTERYSYDLIERKSEPVLLLTVLEQRRQEAYSRKRRRKEARVFFCPKGMELGSNRKKGAKNIAQEESNKKPLSGRFQFIGILPLV